MPKFELRYESLRDAILEMLRSHTHHSSNYVESGDRKRFEFKDFDRGILIKCSRIKSERLNISYYSQVYFNCIYREWSKETHFAEPWTGNLSYSVHRYSSPGHDRAFKQYTVFLIVSSAILIQRAYRNNLSRKKLMKIRHDFEEWAAKPNGPLFWAGFDQARDYNESETGGGCVYMSHGIPELPRLTPYTQQILHRLSLLRPMRRLAGSLQGNEHILVSLRGERMGSSSSCLSA